MRNSEPVIAGNKILVPGSYVWKLLDSPSNRHIVQVSDQKTGVIQTTILAIPDYRAEPSSDNLMQFWETPKGMPRAVRSWFYPGDNYGQRFIYPRDFIATLEARRPAARTLLAHQRKAAPLQIALLQPKPQAAVPAAASARAAEPRRSGSWAVITGGKVPASADASSKRHGGLWDTIKNLPLTATLAPLIGMIGVAAIVLWLITHLKRRNGSPALP